VRALRALGDYVKGFGDILTSQLDVECEMDRIDFEIVFLQSR
jgi:hypothetical protein